VPYTSSCVEVEQLSVTREGFNSPTVTVSEGAGERNNANADVYVVSADDHASDSRHVGFTSGATPIPEEIPHSINEMVSELW
jgi:hypothetical protein